MKAAQDGDPEGYVLQALTQTGGRGRHGNKWEAPMGNIYMSLLLRPDCELAKAGEVAFVIAVALSNTLDRYIDPDKHRKALKWPNDILIDGLKISGILLETNITEGRLDGLVVGIGLNVFQAPELAVHLHQVAKEPVYVNKVRDCLLEEIEKAYQQWQEDGFASIREKWLQEAYGIGKPMTARLPDISYEGVFEGLSEDGSLLLKEEDGSIRSIHAGEVHFAP